MTRGGVLVEGGHRGNRLLNARLGGVAALDGGGGDAGAEGLGEDEHVALTGADVAQDAVGVHGAGDGQPVLDLLVDDGVAADDDRAGFLDLVGAAPQHLAQHLDVHLSLGEADDVEAPWRARRPWRRRRSGSW